MVHRKSADDAPLWTVADRLRKAREHAGLDQRQLAQLIGISRNSVGNYERGRTAPRLLVVKEWARVTGVPPWWILGEGGAAWVPEPRGREHARPGWMARAV